MKRKLALILALALLTGCTAQTSESTEEMRSVTEQAGQTRTETAESAELPESAEAHSKPSEVQPNISDLVNSGEKYFSANGQLIELTNEEWEEVLTAFAALQTSERVYPKTADGEYDIIQIAINGTEHSIVRVNGEGGYLMIDGGGEYSCEADFAKLFGRYCVDDSAPVSGDSAEDRLVGLSVQCSEPTTQQEYLETARAIVAQWLDTLPAEEGRYHLESYTFVDDLADNRVFHGDGYVNGGREFVCYVGFDTPTEDDSTAFFAAGTYDTFYHYYFGPGVLARFRWENGVCTLIDYDEAFAMLTSDRLKDGLFGISANESEYKTFYDFMNDKENVAEWLTNGVSYRLCSYTVSHNVMMLSNGNVVYADIGNSDRPTYEGDLVTTDMHKYFYDSEGEGIYSSPVDYVDGSGAVVMTYTDGFPLVFDDYNHDGNPDYALRIRVTENGSEYDVRCMDINGTPWEDNKEIFLYGEFAESVRLQVSDSGAVLKPVADENGGVSYEEVFLFSDKSNASHADVTDGKDMSYRMYSQRFFLPEELRCYTAEDSEVLCYFWNNTAQSVTVGGAYEIQRSNGGKWETVGAGITQKAMVEGNSHAELCFDISAVTSDEISVYRIKTSAGGTAVYGGFYYGTQTAASLEVTSGQFPSGADAISFDISNTGMAAVFPEAGLYRGEEKLCDVSVGRLDSGKEQKVFITESDISGEFAAGDYTLRLVVDGREFSCAASVIEVPEERLHYFPERVTAKRDGGDIIVPLTNNIWSGETVTIEYFGSVTVLGENGGETVYINEESYDLEIACGETVEIRFSDYSPFLEEYEKYFEELKQDEELMEIYAEEIEGFADMSFEEFVSEVLGIVTPEKGDLCRMIVHIDDAQGTKEYIYFEMP